MTGLSTLQQGPLGVAASASRPAPRPGALKRVRIADSASANLDSKAPPRTPDRPSQDSQDQGFEGFTPIVSPSTLLEIGLIIAAMPPSDNASTLAPQGRISAWAPPQSSLALRDRSV